MSSIEGGGITVHNFLLSAKNGNLKSHKESSNYWRSAVSFYVTITLRTLSFASWQLWQIVKHWCQDFASTSTTSEVCNFDENIIFCSNWINILVNYLPWLNLFSPHNYIDYLASMKNNLSNSFRIMLLNMKTLQFMETYDSTKSLPLFSFLQH